MQAKKYEDSGSLNPQTDKVSEKSPDWWGSVELSKEMLKDLLEKAKNKEPLKIKVSAWHRQGSKGEFMSLALKAWEGRPAQKRESNDEWA